MTFRVGVLAEALHGKRDHRIFTARPARLLEHDLDRAREPAHRNRMRQHRRVGRILAVAGSRPPARWLPRLDTLLYLRTRGSRCGHDRAALAIARLLLDRGADPDDFYMAGDARYTVLTGVAGEGEQDAPRQPYAPALFVLLLERGAEPFDIQVLYNTHFSGDMLWWLELVHRRTIGSQQEARGRDDRPCSSQRRTQARRHLCR